MMIGGNGSPSNRPNGRRMIVRRSRPAVGSRQRAIVKRTAPRGVQPIAPAREKPSHRPLIPRRSIAVAFVLVVVAGAVAGGVWAWQSPIFRVQAVEVRGNAAVPAEVIVDRAALHGKSMFAADLDRAQRDLYEIALLRSVRIERQWPDRITIEVREREPWATWEQAGTRYMVDRDGVVLGHGEAPAGGPVIVSAGEYSLQPGDRVDYQAIAAAADIYAQLPERLGTTVVEVAYLPGKGVRVTTADGQVALLGDSSGISYKLAVWAAVAEEARRQGLSYSSIDLRYGNRPVLQ